MIFKNEFRLLLLVSAVFFFQFSCTSLLILTLICRLDCSLPVFGFVSFHFCLIGSQAWANEHPEVLASSVRGLIWPVCSLSLCSINALPHFFGEEGGGRFLFYLTPVWLQSNLFQWPLITPAFEMFFHCGNRLFRFYLMTFFVNLFLLVTLWSAVCWAVCEAVCSCY